MHTINQTYGHNARFDGVQAGMTEDQIHAKCPSVFATTAHASRSERFAPIPTIEVLRGLRKEGFEVVGAKQSVTRVPGKSDYTKHLIRIRKMDADASYKVGDTVAEILLRNANDGTACYDLFAGLFRIRCLNSLVASMGSIDSVKIRHTGKNIVNQVIDGTFSVVENAKLALAAPEQWSQIQLDKEEKLALAEAARVLRFGDHVTGEVNSPVVAEQFLQTRRRDDASNDLWTVFNIAQENMIRGGLKATVINESGKRRRMSTKSVNGIDADVRLNRALWQLTNRMAEIRGVKIEA